MGASASGASIHSITAFFHPISRRFPNQAFFFNSAAVDLDAWSCAPGEEGGHEHDSLSLRIQRLRKDESVGSAFRGWMGDGNPVHRGHIFYLINRFRKRKLNRRALEVMEWVIRERPYKVKELDYSYLLEFTSKLYGVGPAEKLFTRVPQEFKNELLYNNLVMACLDRSLVRLSLSYMKKMRELSLPISHLVFNRLLVLRSSPAARSPSIPLVLAQMKADGVPPHVSTFNILMKLEASRHRLLPLLRLHSRMEECTIDPDEVSFCILATAHAAARLPSAAAAHADSIERTASGKNRSTLNVLLMLYGFLGRPADLARTWDAVIRLPNVPPKSYSVAIEAFGRVGDVSRAEETFSKMRSVGPTDITRGFNSIISVYCRHGMERRALEAYGGMRRAGGQPNGITFRNLALGWLRAGREGAARRVLELGAGVKVSRQVGNSGPWLETTLSILELWAERGDVDAAERMFRDLERVRYSRYTFVFNALIKAYVTARLWDPHLLRRMILGGARPDNETYSLLHLLEQFRS